jgi:hypothetical protein
MAKSAVAITIEGVLQKMVSSAPIPVGIQLYHGLAETFQVLLITDSDKKETDYWLRLENLNKHGVVSYADPVLMSYPVEVRRERQIKAFSARGFIVDLVIDPDPAICRSLLLAGYTVLPFIHHLYSYPEWRPDFEGEVRPWDRFEEEIAREMQLRNSDTRTKKHEQFLSGGEE